jgi:hypothetical protein
LWLCEAEDKCNGTSTEVSFQLDCVVQPLALHAMAIYAAKLPQMLATALRLFAV